MADGILICAGGERLSREAGNAIGVLRRLGCKLPVEIWKMPEEHLGLPDMPNVAVNEIAAPGGWELKAIALKATHLDRVLLLDADTICAQDPTPLFDLLGNGAVFWPSDSMMMATAPAWAAAGVVPAERQTIDSSQMLVDKAACARAVDIAAAMNRDSAKWYKLVYGDADTFLLAWLAAGVPYTMVMSQMDQTPDGGRWQHHPVTGLRLFHHSPNLPRKLDIADGTYRILQLPPQSQRNIAIQNRLGGRK